MPPPKPNTTPLAFLLEGLFVHLQPAATSTTTSGRSPGGPQTKWPWHRTIPPPAPGNYAHRLISSALTSAGGYARPGPMDRPGLRPWTRRRRWIVARRQARDRVLAALREDGSLPQAYNNDDDETTADATALLVVMSGRSRAATLVSDASSTGPWTSSAAAPASTPTRPAATTASPVTKAPSCVVAGGPSRRCSRPTVSTGHGRSPSSSTVGLRLMPEQINPRYLRRSRGNLPFGMESRRRSACVGPPRRRHQPATLGSVSVDGEQPAAGVSRAGPPRCGHAAGRASSVVSRK